MNYILKTGGICCLFVTACNAYLDLKPDGSMAVPENMDDCRALLDDFNTMNMGYPNIGDAASDDYYLQFEDWNALPLEARDNYIWNPQTQHALNQWYSPYKIVYQSNQVLEVLAKNPRPADDGLYLELQGGAHFFRGYALYALASVFAPPYRNQTARTDLGIPLRLTATISEESKRAVVEDTYRQIVSDLKHAAHALPVSVAVRSRPSKGAAWAALARVYLEMGEYDHARAYADSCLDVNGPLLDFNVIDASAPFPFARFNGEVIFHALAIYAPSLTQQVAKIDSSLYAMYDARDLRKRLYFQGNSESDKATYAFKGSYDGSSSLFYGITTSEILLIRAECQARMGDSQAAISDLQTLYRHRFQQDAEPEIATVPEELLRQILTERRKELLFRGRRWSDLRRLNLIPGFETELFRKFDNITYQLLPNDPRYSMLIPNEVIQITHIQQNKR
ncbi:RagB/SusD family nutrient uptake outer membrane protein [Parapedobacter defluvii]|uniref:RagB/SusD family nutrient uptake outer membrane protein n=1 Tax=Parapedobacter defluvii TaxID=2045106 RepID=UPI000FA834F2|nr:MAG: RagB/SusD family nutrient uptake outer membrane protein [Parapedobacter sp.]